MKIFRVKKVCAAAAVLYCLSAAPVSAFDPTSFPNAVDGAWMLNLGAGVGMYFQDKEVTVPIVFSFERALPISVPLSVGGIVGFTIFEHNYYSVIGNDMNGNAIYDDDQSYKSIAFGIPMGVRLAYHFNFEVDELDVYAAIDLGLTLAVGTVPIDPVTFLFGAHVGVRYFFGGPVGVFLEVGAIEPHIAAAGIGFRF
ncbi:MAG: hypothetical protein LBD24_01590 [Spirochaetaceae bacterium]|jgi:hypothetical protein|nr:hypothetical protein [Spirochaetaceae bacterium]